MGGRAEVVDSVDRVVDFDQICFFLKTREDIVDRRDAGSTIAVGQRDESQPMHKRNEDQAPPNLNLVFKSHEIACRNASRHCSFLISEVPRPRQA
jgi:hypothetical protein